MGPHWPTRRCTTAALSLKTKSGAALGGHGRRARKTGLLSSRCAVVVAPRGVSTAGAAVIVAQFAGHDPALMVAAGKLVQHECDAIDVNLGCPQNIARRGNYGAHLAHRDKPLVYRIGVCVCVCVCAGRGVLGILDSIEMRSGGDASGARCPGDVQDSHPGQRGGDR